MSSLSLSEPVAQRTRSKSTAQAVPWMVPSSRTTRRSALKFPESQQVMSLRDRSSSEMFQNSTSDVTLDVVNCQTLHDETSVHVEAQPSVGFVDLRSTGIETLNGLNLFHEKFFSG
jgi:hypothetical protein